MTTPKPNPTDPGYGFNEFQWDALYKMTLRDTCGEFALEHAEAQADGKVANVTDMLFVNHDMINAGLRKLGTGGTTLWGLAREAERRQYTILTEWDYSANFTHDWHTTIKDNAGRNPMVLFFVNGQALVDAETGIGYSYRTPWKPDFKNHPLSGHFIEVAAVFNEGYLCVDGANPDVLKRYQVYRYDTLNAAQVRGLLVLAPKGKPMAAPYNTLANNTLSYKTGTLGAGFSEWVLKNKFAADLVTPGELTVGDATYCVFADMQVLYWSAASGVVDMGKSGRLVLGLGTPVQVPTVSPAVKAALVAAANVLNPYVDASSQVNAALKGL